MSNDFNIYTYEEQDIDLKNSGKIKIKCFKDDDVTLNINVFNYGEGVDLSKYNKEIRFVKPNGDLYSESHKLEAKGNLLKIECNRQLTVMAGIIKGSIRLWNNENKQKRSYPIIVEVIENGEENLNSKNEISVKENLDDSINKALILEGDLNSSIKSSEEHKNALDKSISNSNNTKIKLDESDKVAKDTKVKLDESCSNGQNIIKSINDKIDVANKTKNNLDSSNIEADKVKNNLDKSKDDAYKVKLDLNRIKDESKEIISSLNNSNETAKSNKQILDERINQSNSKINELNTAIDLSENKNNELKSTNKISDINKKNLDVANTLAKSNIEEMKNFGDVLSLEKDVNILKKQMPSNKNILEKVSQPSLDCWYDKYTKNEIDNKISQVITDLDWKESVNTVNDIVKFYPKPDDGWTVNVKDNNITYRYDGSKWIDISSNSIPLATNKLDGRMSKNDKIKLDGIANNANNYSHPNTHEASIIVQDSTHRFTTDSERANINDCNNKKHIHDNKSVLDGITITSIDTWNSAHSHRNDNIKHITSDERSLWNTISNKVNKTEIPTSLPANGGNADTVDGKYANEFLLKNCIRIDNKDLNTLITPGIYAVANCKNSLYSYCYCIVMKWNSNNDTCQILISNNSVDLVATNIRIGNNDGSWSEWKSVSFQGHTHTKNEVTDIPTKLSQFDNDKGFITSKDVDTSQSHVHSNKIILDNINQETVDDIATLKKQVLENAYTKVETNNILTKLINCTGGFVHNMQIRGKTLQNCIPQGFNSYKKVDPSLSVSSGILTMIGNNSWPTIYYKDFIFKPNTTYTLRVIVNELNINNYDDWQLFRVGDGTNENAIYVQKPTTTGLFVTKFTTASWVSNADTYLRDKATNNNKIVLSNLLILEGDWTNKEIPSYFEGIKSVGEQEGNKISILSHGKNLFDMTNIFPNIDRKEDIQGGIYLSKDEGDADNLVVIDNKIKCGKSNQPYRGCYFYFKLNPNTKYIISFDIENDIGVQARFMDDTRERYIQKNTLSVSYSFITNSLGVNSLRLESQVMGYFYLKNIQIEDGTKATAYESYKGDKTEILIPNEPLRGLPNGSSDVIDFDKNEITRNVDIIALDSLESDLWNITATSVTTKNTIEFQHNYSKVLANSDVKCNNFISYEADWLWNKDVEGITVNQTKNIQLRINKSRLSTPDSVGLNKWLKENKTLFVYQLTTPTIEKLNIKDILQSFENGYIQLDNAITPTTQLEYSTNLPSVLGGLTKVVAHNVDEITNIESTISDMDAEIGEARKDKNTLNERLEEDKTNILKTIGQVNVETDGDIASQLKEIVKDSCPIVEATGINSYIASTAGITNLAKGTRCTLFIGTNATGNCSLNLNNYGVKSIKDNFGSIVTNMKSNIPYNICYNGMDFILQGRGGGGNATASKILKGYTASTDKGFTTGEIEIKENIRFRPSTSTKTLVPAYYNNADIEGDSNLVSNNILSGVSIFGVKGNVKPAYFVAKKNYIKIGGKGTTYDIKMDYMPTFIQFYLQFCDDNWNPELIESDDIRYDTVFAPTFINKHKLYNGIFKEKPDNSNITIQYLMDGFRVYWNNANKFLLHYQAVAFDF